MHENIMVTNIDVDCGGTSLGAFRVFFQPVIPPFVAIVSSLIVFVQHYPIRITVIKYLACEVLAIGLFYVAGTYWKSHESVLAGKGV